MQLIVSDVSIIHFSNLKRSVSYRVGQEIAIAEENLSKYFQGSLVSSTRYHTTTSPKLIFQIGDLSSQRYNWLPDGCHTDSWS